MMGIIRAIFLAQNMLASIAMGIYLHRIFFGAFLIFSAVAPPTITTAYVMKWVAGVGVVYLFSQGISVLFRPPGSVFSVIGAWLFSTWPIAEVGAFWIFGSGDTLLQKEAWW